MVVLLLRLFFSVLIPESTARSCAAIMADWLGLELSYVGRCAEEAVEVRDVGVGVW